MSAVPVPISNTDPLAEAVQDFINAKRAEDQARALRLKAEERILALRPAREEGAEMFEAGGFKVTLTGKLAYKCDEPKALAEACAGAGWPSNLIPVKTEIKLDEMGAKWLRANDPTAWASIARFVTVAPAKTAVSVKV